MCRKGNQSGMSARIGYPCRQCRVSWLQAANDRSQAWESQAGANREGPKTANLAIAPSPRQGRVWGRFTSSPGAGPKGREAPIPDLPVLAPGTGRLGKGDSLTGREFRRLRVGCQQFRKPRGIAAGHAAFGGYAVDPDIAPGGGEASGVASHVVAVNEAEIELGFLAQLQSDEGCEIGVVGALFRHRQVEELDRPPHPGRDRIDDLDHDPGVLRLDQ